MHKIRLLTIILLFVSGCVQEEQNAEVFFCPEDFCEERTITAINSAENSVQVAMYAFTSHELFEALKEAKERGVEVKVILDRLPATSKYSQKQNLTESGISTRIMLQKTMHNKFVVIDNELVLTGSFNWTSNADEKNDENLVFLADKKIASQYSEEFFELWIEAG
ncbi:MAG TPA: phospholipase D-like domain-containing protein [archaeon]|nr:phospholipase D-like domain-containing protein [archaeon]